MAWRACLRTTAAAGLALRLRDRIVEAAGAGIGGSRAAAARGSGFFGGAVPAAARSGGDARRRAADAGFGQHELHLAGRGVVACDLGDDGAHLLVAGGHQEGRRAPVGLGADDEEAWLGMGQFLDAMRRHGAAGVDIRVDQRRKRGRRLDGGIEAKAQFAQEREVRPETCRDHDAVDLLDGRRGRRASLRP